MAVALVEEGRELRNAGIEVPILLLSEPRPTEMVEVVECGLVPTVYSGEGVSAAAAAAGGTNQTKCPFKNRFWYEKSWR